MHYQLPDSTSSITSTANTSEQNPSIPENEKKSLRKSSTSQKITVNSFSILKKQSSSDQIKSLKKQISSEEVKPPKEKEEGISYFKNKEDFPSVKSVKQVFSNNMQKNYSVEERSFPLSTTSSRSLAFSFPIDNERPDTPKTPRLNASIKGNGNINNKRKERRKTPQRFSPSTANPSPLPTLQTIQDIGKHLANFTQLYQEQLDKFPYTFEAKETKSEEEKESEKEIIHLARQMLVENLGKEWEKLRQEMNVLFKPSDEIEAMADEEVLGLHSLNLSVLGLEHQADLSIDHEKSLSQTRKSLKSEKRLQVAFDGAQELRIDFDVSDPWMNKMNIKKMSQFINTKQLDLPENKDKTRTIAFTYITQLILLGELLKQFGSELDKSKADDFSITLVEYAFKFMKHMDKAIKKKEAEEKKFLLDNFCHQFGNCIIKYACKLAKRFTNHLKENEERDFHNYLSGNLEEAIQQNCLTHCGAFQADLERAIKAKFLVLSSDKEVIKIPQISQAVRKASDSGEYHDYCYNFLQFLMKHLGIDVETPHIEIESWDASDEGSDEILHLADFNPLIKLKEIDSKKNDATKSMGKIYEELEKRSEKIKEKSPEAALQGVFKLLPILRVFNQNNILAIHKGIVFVQNGLEMGKSNKITSDFPWASSKKTRQSGQLLDRESKNIHINFTGDTVQVTFKRVTALANAPTHTEQKLLPSDIIFNNCPVTTNIILSASIDDLENWTVQTSVDIKRSSQDNHNLAFLSRYSLLIAILETMGISYNVKQTDQ